MKPNVLVVLSDQQRWDTMDFVGVQKQITPNLDRIADTGTFFNNCFSVQPVCGPSRACLQSGRYATETGNYKNGCSLPADCDTMAKYAKEQGYETAYIGKWHIYQDSNPLNKVVGKFDVPVKNRAGYDFWQASNALEFTSHAYDGYLFDTNNKKIKIEGYRADFITQLALKYLQNRKSDKPFFLFLSFLEPHQQNDLKRFTGPKGGAEKFADFTVPEDLKGKKGDYLENLPDYLAMCANLDQNVGKIEQCLCRLGAWDNTVFFYSSDHGCHFRTRNEEYKRSCHDASIHVPLIAHGPGFMNRGREDSLVTLLDVPASALEAIGVPTPRAYRGLPLQKEAVRNRGSVFVQVSEDTIGRCVRTHDWKYCVTYDEKLCGFEQSSSPIYYESHLYDLKKDPAENQNLVKDMQYAAVRAQLRDILLHYIADVEHETPQILPAEANKNADKKYSFRMTLQEMLDDEKSRAVVERVIPMLVHSKDVALGSNLKFYFLQKYMQKVPTMRKKIEQLEKELDQLND